MPDGHRAISRLAVANHQHVRNLLQLGCADLITNLLLTLVYLDPQPFGRQACANLSPVLQMPVRNRQNHHLHGRQPQGKTARVVLDQQRDEPLEAAENGPMDDDGAMLGVVGADVLQIESFGHLVVELDRGALPLSPDGVRDVEIDLRTVERPITLVDRIVPADRIQRALELFLRVVPRLHGSEELRRPCRKLHLGLEPEVAVDAMHQAQQRL